MYHLLRNTNWPVIIGRCGLDHRDQMLMQTSLFSIFWKKFPFVFSISVFFCYSFSVLQPTLQWWQWNDREIAFQRQWYQKCPIPLGQRVIQIPVLNRLKFFLLDYMKEEIHQAWPDSITEVKQRIWNFIVSIADDLLQRPWMADLYLAKAGGFRPMQGCLRS